MVQTGIYVTSLLTIIVIILCMCLIAFCGFLDHEQLDIGHEHYAEITRFSRWEVMPLNTLVNVGYIVVSIYWCGITRVSNAQGILKSWDCCFFYTFNNMACAYGTVSIIRMVTQKALWAIIDRWFTLLFFALVPLWSSHIRTDCKFWVCVLTMVVSMCSYFITTVSSDLYEVVVGLHILRAIYEGYKAYSKHPSSECLYYFYAALGSCFLFVSGNLLDLKLPAISFVFKYISGHFISRVFDAAQIHFTNSFFFDLTLEKAANISVEEKKKRIKELEELQNGETNDIRYENLIKWKDI